MNPQEKGIRLAVSDLNGSYASGMGMPARGGAALALRYDLPLLLLSAAALPILKKYRLISFYRQSSQCGERSNAAFGTQSAAKQSSLAPHDSKARLRVVTTRRDSWRSHVHRTYTAQRVQSFKLQTGNVSGVEGEDPSPFSGDFKRGILFGKRIPLLVGSSVTRCITTPRSARIIMLLYGRMKRQLFGSARCRWRTLSHSAYPGAQCG